MTTFTVNISNHQLFYFSILIAAYDGLNKREFHGSASQQFPSNPSSLKAPANLTDANKIWIKGLVQLT